MFISSNSAASKQGSNGMPKKRVDGVAVANGGGAISSQNAANRKVIQKPAGISPQKKSSMGMANERAPGAAGKADLAVRDPDGARRDGGNSEYNLFNKHYNKELKLCEDEIPMVLCELNESALAYLSREQYDNALLLLQKAHGVLDVVDLSGSRRDLYIALQLFHNMAMCYQKQGQLEECALCLETTLDHLGSDYASERGQSFAMRCFKMKLEVKLRLQFCAILSQLHRHKEAFEQALEGIKISHLIVRDKIALCRYYSKRMELNEQFGISGSESFAHEQSQRGGALSESASHSESNAKRAKSGLPSQRNKRRDQDGADAVSKSSFPFEEDMQAGQFQSCRMFDDVSVDSLGELRTEQAIYNNLEGSISIHEKVARKLLPIYKSLLYKIQQLEKRRASSPERAGQKSKTRENERDASAPNENGRGGRLLDFHEGAMSANESSDVDSKSAENVGRGGLTRPSSSKAAGARSKSGLKRKRSNNGHTVVKGPVSNVDLRHILGFLNQTEWIQNLNIGNIMQIAPLKQEEMTAMRRNEEMLTRESFLDVISFLIVGYFCASTEIRFIIQLKDEISKFENFSIEGRTQESELWHTMSLDVACSFLPSDCPLLNHILLSYQKHHAPSQTKIPEHAALDERLRVIKPQTGIDNSKFQPIIRVLSHVKVDLGLAKMEPAQKRVNKLLRSVHEKHKLSQDRATQLQKRVAKSEVKTQYQQAQKDHDSAASKKLTNRQAMKLLKLEKVVSKYAKEVNVDKQTILRFLLGDQEETSMQRRLEMQQQLSYKSVQSFTNGYTSQNQVRPQSHHEQHSARRLDSAGAEANSSHTATMAAKLAYHNMKRAEGDQINSGPTGAQSKPNIGLTSIGQKGQANGAAAGTSSQNWKMSPQSYIDSRNGKNVQVQGGTANALTASAELEQERLLPQGAPDGAQAASAPMRSQRQPKTANGPSVLNQSVEGRDRKHDSDASSLRDNSFMHDLSQSNLHLVAGAPHHDKSFNDAMIDERNRLMLLNQSDIQAENNMHNLSMQGGVGTQANRTSNKRGQSHDRVGGKVQRPRSSKGYRGNLQAGPPGPAGATTVQNQSLEQHRASSNHASAQKFHSTKSEERALKTSQNQRSLVTKGPRQKTAGAVGSSTAAPNSTTHIASHTTHSFNTKDTGLSQSANASMAPPGSGPVTGVLQSKKLASLSSQMQSQSSSQLISAQNTGNLNKLTKKQLQHIQAHQQSMFNLQSGNNNLAPHNGMQLSSMNSQQNLQGNLQFQGVPGANGKKTKMNYEDLKKFLHKDPNASNGQMQQLMAQHVAQAAQSQTNFLPNQLSGDQSLTQPEMLPRGRSQPGLGKGKKITAQSQSQLNQQLNMKDQGVHHLATSATTGNLMAIGDADNAGNGPVKNRDIKEFYKRSTDEDKEASAQAHKKMAAAKSRSQTGTGANSKRQQQEQIYLNSLAVHPSSQQASHRAGAGSREGTGGGSRPGNRGDNNRSALAGPSPGTLHAQPNGGHQSQASFGQKHSSLQGTEMPPSMAISQHQLSNQNPAPQLKRREIKGRLMMQEWLTKSGNNLPPAGTSQMNNNMQSQQQFVGQLGAQQQAQSQPVSGKGNGKFIPKQIIGFDVNSSGAPLTKQQQNHLMHMQMAQSANSNSQQQFMQGKPLPPPGSAESQNIVAAGSSLNSRGASKERENRRRSQPQ